MDFWDWLLIFYCLDRSQRTNGETAGSGIADDVLAGIWRLVQGCGVLVVVVCLLLFVAGAVAWVLEAVGRLLRW